MPHVEGISLRDRMTREKQLPINEAVRIASEVAGALDYAHRHGVIHRDIKPENIMLHDGSALVADFGIALVAKVMTAEPAEFAFRMGDGGNDRPYVAISADGRRVLMALRDSVGVAHVVTRDLWLFDRVRGVSTQLTHAPGAAFSALWMPDSHSIIYSFEDPVYDLHRIPIDASAPDAAVHASPYDKRALSISPDGARLLFTEEVDRNLLRIHAMDGKVPAPGG